MAASRSAPPAVPLGESFTHRLHRLHKLTDRVSQQAYVAQAGLSLSEGRCLAAIGAFTPLSVNDLAQHANLNKAQASRAAQALVDQGLVVKAASATDGRGVVLTLTASGRAAWQRVMRVIGERNEAIVSCLSEAERRQLDRLLDKLVRHAEAGDTGAGEGESD
ncbi:MarR family winged helix-turn-helix transcriptional regulator [Ramlibacter sp.]|uniref:MarR family winged helix-turn-helix transcriptional regulator n=1 Tax=Ramlibacter sp. TaxID=1917967 RepID=UPI0035B21895